MGTETEKEPTMEEILASIRRIISEEGEQPGQASPEDDASAQPQPEETLELAEPIEDAVEPQHGFEVSEQAEPVSVSEEQLGLLSEATKTMTSQSLSALSAMVVRNYEGSENTLEGLVREMLKPMLREWLDANLPDIVESMVAREIARITGRD